MKALKKLLLTNAVFGSFDSLTPYRLTTHSSTTRAKPPKNNGKPTSKVIYYTDENGHLKRKKEKL